MFLSRSLIVLTWGLMFAPGAAAAPDSPDSTARVRRIELRADERSSLPEVLIRPGFSTTVFFDAPIQPEQVELEGRERFQRVGITEDHLALVPSSFLRQGERLRLQVRFKDSAVPELAALMLVVDTTKVEPQVELYRRPRTAESYRQEVDELKVAMRRLQHDVEQLRGAPLRAGTIESLVASMEDKDSLQYEFLALQRTNSPFPMDVPQVASVLLNMRWAALRVTLTMSAEEADWTAAGASLTDAQGRLTKTRPPWQPGPVRFARQQAVVVLLEDAMELQPGRYTLKLWDEGGRTVTLEGITVK